MSPDNIKQVRREVEENGWTIIWLGAEMPCAFLNDPVELLYEDMDGQPCVCEATYTYDKGCFEFRPYFRRTDGAKMVKCIAWKKREVSNNAD
jgi:hypothetical protein